MSVPSAREFPQVSTRYHFTPRGVLEDGKPETGYDFTNRHRVPGIGSGTDAPKELTLYVHGVWNRPGGAAANFVDAATALENAGYEYPVVGYTWDSDTLLWPWAKRIADRNGPKLARFVHDYRSSRDTGIRIVAHSLGSRVTMATLRYLRSTWNETDAVESVALLGGAIPAASTAAGNEFGDVVRAFDGTPIDNYWSKNDGVLGKLYKPAEFGTDAIGKTGATGEIPDNVHDHEVSDVVDGHSEYNRPGGGCIQRVLDNFDP